MSDITPARPPIPQKFAAFANSSPSATAAAAAASASASDSSDPVCRKTSSSSNASSVLLSAASHFPTKPPRSNRPAVPPPYASTATKAKSSPSPASPHGATTDAAVRDLKKADRAASDPVDSRAKDTGSNVGKDASGHAQRMNSSPSHLAEGTPPKRPILPPGYRSRHHDSLSHVSPPNLGPCKGSASSSDGCIAGKPMRPLKQPAMSKLKMDATQQQPQLQHVMSTSSSASSLVDTDAVSRDLDRALPTMCHSAGVSSPPSRPPPIAPSSSVASKPLRKASTASPMNAPTTGPFTHCPVSVGEASHGGSSTAEMSLCSRRTSSLADLTPSVQSSSTSTVPPGQCSGSVVLTTSSPLLETPSPMRRTRSMAVAYYSSDSEDDNTHAVKSVSSSVSTGNSKPSENGIDGDNFYIVSSQHARDSDSNGGDLDSYNAPASAAIGIFQARKNKMGSRWASLRRHPSSQSKPPQNVDTESSNPCSGTSSPVQVRGKSLCLPGKGKPSASASRTSPTVDKTRFQNVDQMTGISRDIGSSDEEGPQIDSLARSMSEEHLPTSNGKAEGTSPGVPRSTFSTLPRKSPTTNPRGGSGGTSELLKNLKKHSVPGFRGKKMLASSVSQGMTAVSGNNLKHGGRGSIDTGEYRPAIKSALRPVPAKPLSTEEEESDADGVVEGSSLFQYVLVISLNKDDSGKYSPQVSYRFPPKLDGDESSKDDGLQSIPAFCFPDLQCWTAPVSSYKSETFSFILTDVSGSKRFGYCRRLLPSGKRPRMPEVYCLISPMGCFNLYSKILDQVELRISRSTSAVFAFLKAVSAKPFPRPGRKVIVSTFGAGGLETVVLKRPKDSIWLEHVDFGTLTSKLGPDMLLKIFAGMVMERHVIFVAERLSTLSSCILACVALLYPFEWQHVFIPVLPASLIDICCSPLPYVIGVMKAAIDPVVDGELPIEENVMIVDLDEGKFMGPIYNDVATLPHRFRSDLADGMKMACSKSGDAAYDPSVMVDACVNFFVQTVGHYRKHFKDSDDLDFDIPSFTKTSSKSLTEFLTAFTKTQMFDMFIQERYDPANAAAASNGLFEQALAERYGSQGDDVLNIRGVLRLHRQARQAKAMLKGLIKKT